jgi:cytoskeletal protein CcmA (bactofilin family)
MKCSGIVTRVLCVVLFTAPVYALTSRTGDAVKVAFDEVVDDDVILLGQSINVEGKVMGDVYAFGQTVRISGDIGGSVFMVGANITIDARTVETVWAAGGSIEILSSIQRNAVLAGGKVSLRENARIGKDLGAYTGDLSVEGRVDGTLRGRVGKFTLSGTSGRVKIKAEQARLTSSAQILGDFILSSAKEPSIEEGALIAGEQRIEKPKAEDAESIFAALAPMIAFLFVMVKIVIFIAKVIVGVLLIALFQRYVRRIMDTLITNTWKSLGWGFLGVIVIPVAIVILFAILIGYPLGVFGAYIYTILWYLSSIFVSLVIGEKVIQLFKKEGEVSLYVSFIVGILILFVVGFIPILNFLVRIFTLLFGFGAIVVGTWYLIKEIRDKQLI